MIQSPAKKQRQKPDPGGHAEEPVMVFESNLAGAFGKGASVLAEKCHGAVAGKGWGHHGNCYGIPTLDSEMMPLTQGVLTNYIQSFLKYAVANPHLQFRVTAFGFGNPNIRQADVVNMFARAPSNCLLPGRWLELLGKLDTVRIIILDGTAALRNEAAQRKFDDYFAINAPLWTNKSIELISVGTAQSVVAIDQYTRSRKYKHRIVGVNESYYRNYLNQAREEMVVWYATRLISVTDPDQTSQGSAVRILQSAMRAGLELDDIPVNDES